jgi:hypothetical protein
VLILRNGRGEAFGRPAEVLHRVIPTAVGERTSRPPGANSHVEAQSSRREP